MINYWTLYIAVGCGLFALLFAYFKASWISKQNEGTQEVKTIGLAIRQGAMAFLNREYRVLSIFIIVVAILLVIINKGDERMIGISFVVGAICSGLAGFFGMRVATSANTRTAAAAQKGLSQALSIAFSGGSVMGLSVVGLALTGLTALIIILVLMFGINISSESNATLSIIYGFAMGASSIALFARVGGGIYTKAADVGADLVGKVEAGIPEDDPRNPATIADNVGDNVGDVAGMGADLFESYIGSIIGAMVLGAVSGKNELVFLPILLAAVGIVVSVFSTFLVKTKEGGDPQKALHHGSSFAMIVMAIISYFIIDKVAPESFEFKGETYTSLGVFFSTIVGLVGGYLIGVITEYYTGTGKKPVDHIANASNTGSATNIIAGLAVGMRSSVLPILIIALVVVISYELAWVYGSAMAALGMLLTTGIQLAVDAYGPIADNAGGIAEMSKLPDEVRERTDKLDAVGNTTAAIGKGFAIGSAAITSLALFAAYQTTAGVDVIDISNSRVMAGLFIGAMLPFLFSAMVMEAVGRAAFSMIEEVRRQFKTIPGLLKGEGKADYAKCVDISTKASIREMILPGILAIASPLVVGFVFGKDMLGGLLGGVLVSGVAMALFMSNAGGAWDNAKKTIEGGAHGGKGSEAHKAAVTGDTVGDPFKDTAGPALNILIKLMSVVALVIAHLLGDGII